MSGDEQNTKLVISIKKILAYQHLTQTETSKTLKRVPVHFHLLGFLAICVLALSSALLSASALSKSSTTASDSIPHPPAPPGHAWLEVVEYTVTLAGDPVDFNQTLFKSILADLLPVVEPEDVAKAIIAYITHLKHSTGARIIVDSGKFLK